MYPKLIFHSPSAGWVSSGKKEDFAEFTIDLHIGIGHNKTTRKNEIPRVP